MILFLIFWIDNEFFTDIVVFGSSNFKPDVFASKVVVDSLVDEIASLKARVTALENQ